LITTSRNLPNSGPPAPPILPPRNYREVTTYNAMSDIVMGKGLHPDANDARVVHANLAVRIQRPR
jgi:hypothetical protein